MGKLPIDQFVSRQGIIRPIRLCSCGRRMWVVEGGTRLHPEYGCRVCYKPSLDCTCPPVFPEAPIGDGVVYG
jgi:hypothetical protein